MAKETKRGARTKYSVYRLERTKPNANPNDPKTPWELVAVFETDNDATQAAKLLEETETFDGCTHSVVKEIRDKEVTPPSSRRVV